jgi:hypothetical protein
MDAFIAGLEHAAKIADKVRQSFDDDAIASQFATGSTGALWVAAKIREAIDEVKAGGQLPASRACP